ncbi:MAG: glycosyltransferase family 4 protein [Candidatus Bilamarchaeaceae archaeon]
MDLVMAHPFLNQKGGVERVVLEIADEFEPVIYTAGYEKEKTFPEFREFDVRILPRSGLENAFSFMKGDSRRHGAVSAGLRFYGCDLKGDYDVINAHGTPSEWIANRNGRVLWFCHSPNREAFDLYRWRMEQLPAWKKPLNKALIEGYKQLEFSVLPKIPRICTNSEVTNGRIKKYFKRDDAKVVHPGVDPKKYYCEEYGKYFFYPSRIVPEKRFEMAIEAFRSFLTEEKRKTGKLRRTAGNWRLVIAGYVHDTPREQGYLDRLRKMSEGLPVEFKLNIGEEEITSLYANCRATVFCGINEDWGLTPVESMASSKPCISVDEGGPRYSIVDGKTGFLVEDASEMTEKMQELADDEGLCEKMGKAGRARVLKNYTWGIFLSEMRKGFKSLASR